MISAKWAILLPVFPCLQGGSAMDCTDDLGQCTLFKLLRHPGLGVVNGVGRLDPVIVTKTRTFVVSRVAKHQHVFRILVAQYIETLFN